MGSTFAWSHTQSQTHATPREHANMDPPSSYRLGARFSREKDLDPHVRTHPRGNLKALRFTLGSHKLACVAVKPNINLATTFKFLTSPSAISVP